MAHGTAAWLRHTSVMPERPTVGWRHHLEEQRAQLRAGTLKECEGWALEAYTESFIAATDTALGTFEQVLTQIDLQSDPGRRPTKPLRAHTPLPCERTVPGQYAGRSAAGRVAASALLGSRAGLDRTHCRTACLDSGRVLRMSVAGGLAG